MDVCIFFQLILAFGNYMNSSKRGYALGFKLDSLAKVSLFAREYKGSARVCKGTAKELKEVWGYKGSKGL